MDAADRMKNELFVEPKSDGQIAYGVQRSIDGQALSPASAAAVMAADLLIAARQAHEMTGEPYPSDAADVVMAILEPSTIGIREFPTQEPRVIVEFGFATASLGMSLSLGAAKLLGEQLLAMSADEPRAGAH